MPSARARTAVAVAIALAIALGACGGSAPPTRTVRITILTYHRVHRYSTELTKSVPQLTVEPRRFRAQMEALARAGYRTIGQRDLLAALTRGKPLPPRRVMLTFDDGYSDDVDQVLPVLRRLHMRATFYVNTARVGVPGFLRAHQIRKLDRAGMDVGDHSATHANLPALHDDALRREVAGSRAVLAGIVGHPIDWFAYPYGAHDQRVVDEVERAGYRLAVTTDPGRVASSRAPLAIPRISVLRATTAHGVLTLVRGGRPAG